MVFEYFEKEKNEADDEPEIIRLNELIDGEFDATEFENRTDSGFEEISRINE